MPIYSTVIRGIAARAAGTVAGNAATRLFTTPTLNRAGIEIHNASTSLDLWVRAVNEGAAAPTITLADKDFLIPPNTTLSLAYDSNINVYILNSSGAATTSAYTAREVSA